MSLQHLSDDTIGATLVFVFFIYSGKFFGIPAPEIIKSILHKRIKYEKNFIFAACCCSNDNF